MDFKTALDGLCAKVDHDDVAQALGVSVQTIRQARLGEGTKAKRNPPPDWTNSLIRMAEERVWYYRSLVDRLRDEQEGANA